MSRAVPGFFQFYPREVRPISTIEAMGNAGGLSGARLFRFASVRGLLVARQWPADGLSMDRLQWNHDRLGEAADLEFVCRPLPTLDGRTLVRWEGRLWEVSPWMSGEADLARPPTLTRVRTGFAGLAAFLARFAKDRRWGASPGLIHRAEELEVLLLSEFQKIRLALGLAPQSAPVALTRTWLERAVNKAPQVREAIRKAGAIQLPIQVCIRDARPDHLLFEGDRLTGLIDFGAMGTDSVAGDLARLLTEWVGPDQVSRNEALASFDQVLPLSGEELRAIEPFQLANAWLGAARWARWHFLERRVFDDPAAVIKGLTRALERLDEWDGS